MFNPGAAYKFAEAMRNLALHGEAKRRMELYSDEDLIKVYKISKDTPEHSFGIYTEIHEGGAALDLLRGRHGVLYTENITGLAERGLKGFLNRNLGTSLKASRPPHIFYTLPRENLTNK